MFDLLKRGIYGDKVVSITDGIEGIPEIGVAWQIDRNKVIEYSDAYWKHYVDLEHTPTAIALNKYRCSLVEKYMSDQDLVLDVGIGCGEFIKKLRVRSFGYDINPCGVKWLKDRGIYKELSKEQTLLEFNGITLWDVFEHFQKPEEILRQVRKNGYLFISMPIFNDIHDIVSSKHKKPGEHLQYFTQNGLIYCVTEYGFELIETSDAETLAGRDGVMSFVFKKS
jgi:hypothetical protein